MSKKARAALSTDRQRTRSMTLPYRKPGNAPTLGMILVGAYVVAICFERIIDIEIFKPYRVIGILMIIFAIGYGLKWQDRLLGYAAALLAAGTVPAAITLLGPEGNLFYFLNQASIFIFNLLTYAAIISILKSERDVLIAMALHAAGMLIVMLQILVESHATSFVARIQADFKNPAYVCSGLLAAFIFIFILARQSFAKRGFGAFGWFMLAGLLIVMLYAATLTGSRTGVAAFVLGMVVFVMYLYWKGRNKAVSTLVGASIVVLLMGLTPFVEQVASSESNILAWRIKNRQIEEDVRIGVWVSGLKAGLDSLGLGIGMGQYQAVHARYYGEYSNRAPEVMERDMGLHNEYLTMFTEHGLLGLLIYFLMLAEILRLALTLKNDTYRAYAYATLSALMVLAFGGGALRYFSIWVYLAFIVVLHRAQSEVLFRR